jgi:hypothetical protein
VASRAQWELGRAAAPGRAGGSALAAGSLVREGLRMVSRASRPPATQNPAEITADTRKPWASAAGCR